MVYVKVSTRDPFHNVTTTILVTFNFHDVQVAITNTFIVKLTPVVYTIVVHTIDIDSNTLSSIIQLLHNK